MPAHNQTSQLAEVNYLLRKIEQADIPQDLFQQIKTKIKRLRRMARQGRAASEYEAVAKYVDRCLNMPWGKYVTQEPSLAETKQKLDQLHFGHQEVKSVVLEYLAILKRKRHLAQQQNKSVSQLKLATPTLTFVGVQGSGKTHLAKAIAQTLNRPFTRIPMGALGAVEQLRGAPYNQVSGEPGQIIQSLIKAKVLNPVILLDEIDKVSGQEGLRKNFMAVLLEILDPQQNYSFTDYYLDYPVDLSRVLFITTANRFTTFSRELLDRLDIVQFEEYSFQEKLTIARQFIFPKAMENVGLQPNELTIADKAWPQLVSAYGDDLGVRRLEKNIRRLCRKALKRILLEEQIDQISVTADNVTQFTQDKILSVAEIRTIDYTKLDQPDQQDQVKLKKQTQAKTKLVNNKLDNSSAKTVKTAKAQTHKATSQAHNRKQHKQEQPPDQYQQQAQTRQKSNHEQQPARQQEPGAEQKINSAIAQLETKQNEAQQNKAKQTAQIKPSMKAPPATNPQTKTQTSPNHTQVGQQASSNTKPSMQIQTQQPEQNQQVNLNQAPPQTQTQQAQAQQVDQSQQQVQLQQTSQIQQAAQTQQPSQISAPQTQQVAKNSPLQAQQSGQAPPAQTQAQQPANSINSQPPASQDNKLQQKKHKPFILQNGQLQPNPNYQQQTGPVIKKPE